VQQPANCESKLQDSKQSEAHDQPAVPNRDEQPRSMDSDPEWEAYVSRRLERDGAEGEQFHHADATIAFCVAATDSDNEEEFCRRLRKGRRLRLCSDSDDDCPALDQEMRAPAPRGRPAVLERKYTCGVCRRVKPTNCSCCLQCGERKCVCAARVSGNEHTQTVSDACSLCAEAAAWRCDDCSEFPTSLVSARAVHVFAI